jgi:hypothetical protein
MRRYPSVLTLACVSLLVVLMADAHAIGFGAIKRVRGFEDFEPLSGAWSEERGVITGRATDGAAVLATHDDFADFELTVSFRSTAPCDGGVLLRSHWLPAGPLPEGGSPADLPRHMAGYRVRTDMRDPEQALGITETASGTLLTAAAPKVIETLDPGEWNKLEIHAADDIIEVRVNGVIAARLQDEAYIGGRIALEVLPADGGPGEMQFRDCSVRDRDRAGTWRRLFDGKTLDGWKNWGEEEWSVEDGTLMGRCGPKKSEGYLCTVESWKDFRVRGSFKMLGEGNYGLFYHSTIALRPEDGYPVITGVQGEVEPSWPGMTGWHYESYGRGWIVPGTPGSPGFWALRPDMWNEIEIRAIGNRVTTWVNGIRTVDFHDTGHRIFEGGFALQLHAGGVDGIAWRDLFVED